MSDKKHRNFCFTLYNINEDISDELEKLVHTGFCKTITFTHELGENKNNPHIQGFMICNIPNRLLNVKNKINSLFTIDPNPHIEVANGTSIQNYEYITKEYKLDPSIKHKLFGEKILKPGKKRDDSKFESYVDMIEKGDITIKEIENTDRAHYLRHENYYISLISSLAKSNNNPPPFVAWFSGTTGTGKSYTAKKIANTLGYEIYEAGVENNFFNHYLQEECSIWDDYRSGPIPFNTLLNITDRTGCTINIKGSKVFFKPKIFIFTSPEGINSARTKEMNNINTLDNRFEQLKRRIKYQVNINNDKFLMLSMNDYYFKNNLDDCPLNHQKYLNYCNTFKSIIPDFEIIEPIANEIEKEFLGVYKQHLIENGFNEYVNKHNILKDIIPIIATSLIEKSKDIQLSFKSNVKYNRFDLS